MTERRGRPDGGWSARGEAGPEAPDRRFPYHDAAAEVASSWAAPRPVDSAGAADPRVDCLAYRRLPVVVKRDVPLALGLLWFSHPAFAQVSQPAYHPLQLDCGRYHQEFLSTIELAGTRQRSRETTRRDGVLSVRAAWRDSLLELEAWFDTLSLWREGSGERLEPETDGVVGGRFLGTLTRAGVFTETDRPFVPDDVAQVADVGDALGELFPSLPRRALAPGASWQDGFGTVITRLPDGMRDARTVERYRLDRRATKEESRLLPDSTEVRATRRERETGVFEWSKELGPVRWEREITVEVDVPAGGMVRRPFRTRIEQKATIERVGGGCAAPAP